MLSTKLLEMDRLEKEIMSGRIKNATMEDFYSAIMLKDDVKHMDKLLKTKLNPNTVLTSGRSILMLAGVCGKSEKMIKRIIEAGADIELRDGDGSTALNYAVFSSNLVAAKALINAGANVNITGVVNGYTPLMSAIYLVRDNGHTKMLKMLLEAGANVNEKDEGGISVFMSVVRNLRKVGTGEVIRLFIKHGADIRQRESNGYTPLMVAAMESGCDSTEEAVQILLEVLPREFLDEQDNTGMTAINIAACNVKTADSTENTVRMLLKAGASPSIPQKDGVNPLMMLLMSESQKPETLKTIKMIIAHDPNIVGAQDKDGFTALMRAVSLPEVTKILIEAITTINSALLNQVNVNNMTALSYAVYNDHFETAKLLVNAGADLNVQDIDGATALMLTPDPQMVRLLLSAGTDQTVRDKDGDTALIAAISTSDSDEIVKMLVGICRCGKTQIPIGPTSGSDSGSGSAPSPRKKCRCPHVETSTLNIQNNKGETALMVAIKLKAYNHIHMLLDSKADVTLKNEEGKTAWMLAQEMDLSAEVIRKIEAALDRVSAHIGTEPPPEYTE